MVYKIIWSDGTETAERYSNKSLAQRVLRSSNYSGRVVKTRLGKAGRTMPYQSYTYGSKKIKRYPKGKALKWHRRKVEGGYVYTKHI